MKLSLQSPVRIAGTLTIVAIAGLSLQPSYAQGTLIPLHAFGGADGQYPEASLLQGSNGSFYRITSQGGTDTYGTVSTLRLLVY